MATTRIKDVSKTTTDLASDEYIVADGATNGTQKMARDDAYADWAAAYVAAPTTYKLAPLNSGTNKIDATYLPTGADTAKGAWDANANSPTLIDGTGTAGDYYDVTVAGSQDLGSGSIAYTVGDVVKYDGAVWYKIDSVANVLDGSATAAAGRTTLEVNSIDEDAEATGTKLVSPSLYFDGTNDYLEVADSDKLSFTDGTDDLPFSVGAWVKMEDATSFPVISKFGTSAALSEWVLDTHTDDKLRLRLQSTSSILNDAIAKTDVALTAYEGKWVHIAATYSAESAFGSAQDDIVLYVNGQAVAITASTDGDYEGMSDTGQPVQIGKSGGSLHANGFIKEVKLFNKELSASEIEDVFRHGQLGFADQWGGASGAVYTSDFSAGDNGWDSVLNGTQLGNVDGIFGRNDVLSFTLSGGSVTHRVRALNAGISMTQGKRYRVSFDYYIPAGNTALDGIRMLSGTGGGVGATDITGTYGAWANYSEDLVWTSSTGHPSLYALDGASTTVNGDGDLFYITDVKITEIGTLADFRSERFDASTGKIYDISDNAFVGTSATPPSVVGRSLPVYETGTWTPTITFGGGSTGITYAAQEGVYTRVGNICYVSGFFTLSANGSSTGNAVIDGLPYTSKNTISSYQSITFSRVLNMAGLQSPIDGNINGNATTITLNDTGATGASNIDETNFTATSTIRFSGTYQIQ
jgi:hypothetical protein